MPGLTDQISQYLQMCQLEKNLSPDTRSFISSLSGLSDREKVKRIVWYVDDRIACDITCYAWPDKALTQEGVVRGACMSYAYSVQYPAGAGYPARRL